MIYYQLIIKLLNQALFVLHTSTYRSLAKERPWVGHLTSLPERGIGTLSSILHLTRKECSCQVHCNSMPSRHRIGQRVMYNGTITGFEVESWRYTTLGTAPCHCEHDITVCITLAASAYAKLPCSNLWWSITWSFLLQICIALEAVLLELQVKLAPGKTLI